MAHKTLEGQRNYQARNRERIRRLNRESHLRCTYGIEPEDYERMLAAQHGGCALCGSGPGPRRNLPVDHDHVTGRIRGLLCVPCNSRLGWLERHEAAIVSYREGIAMESHS